MGLPDGARVGKAAPLTRPAIDQRLEDILLDIQVIVVDRRQLVAQGRQVRGSFVDPVAGDVVGGRRGPQDRMAAEVLLDEAGAVMTADNRVGQVRTAGRGTGARTSGPNAGR